MKSLPRDSPETLLVKGINMKCFYHNNQDAVGVCRHCLKGLCNDCAVDFVDGIACKNTCENKAKETVL